MATTYDPEVKAAALAALLAGQSVSHVAETYRIPRGTVADWSAKARGEVTKAAQGARTERLGDLILDNLEAMLKATRTIVESVSQDKDWLKQQSASEVAVLIGVISDKAFRILEALPEPTPEAANVS